MPLDEDICRVFGVKRCEQKIAQPPVGKITPGTGVSTWQKMSEWLPLLINFDE